MLSAAAIHDPPLQGISSPEDHFAFGEARESAIVRGIVRGSRIGRLCYHV